MVMVLSSCVITASVSCSGETTDKIASAAFGPTPVTPRSRSKQFSSSRVKKAEDVEGILLDVAVGEKFCRLSQLESGKRIICCMTRIAHAAAVHNREIGVEQRNCSIQIIKHYRYPFCARSEVELRAWQSAMAIASAASSGRATFSIFKMRRVISMT